MEAKRWMKLPSALKSSSRQYNYLVNKCHLQFPVINRHCTCRSLYCKFGVWLTLEFSHIKYWKVEEKQLCYHSSFTDVKILVLNLVLIYAVSLNLIEYQLLTVFFFKLWLMKNTPVMLKCKSWKNCGDYYKTWYSSSIHWSLVSYQSFYLLPRIIGENLSTFKPESWMIAYLLQPQLLFFATSG